jgi:hypothetical protein
MDKRKSYSFRNITSCYDMTAAAVKDFNLYATNNNTHVSTKRNVNFRYTCTQLIFIQTHFKRSAVAFHPQFPLISINALIYRVKYE